MKIGEIIELTQTEPLSKIAKERLTIGEKPTREGLKSAGCYSISGKRGWYYDGDDKSVPEKSIYDFVPPTRRKGKPITTAENEIATTKEPEKFVTVEVIKSPQERGEISFTGEFAEKLKAVNNLSSQLSDKTADNKITNPTNKQMSKYKIVTQESNNPTTKPVMKKVTYEVEEQLHDQLRIKAIMEKRTVSEIVNEIIKKGLK